jgi:flagellar biosynthesis protein FlhG
VITTTKDNLKFISGGNAISNLLSLSDLERHKIIQSFETISTKPDFLIIDVGAGAEASSMSFMASANKVVIVLTGEPTSFIDAYSLIKAAYLDYKMDNFGVIINMANSNLQAKLNFDKFQSITQKFLDVKLNFLGHVPSSLKIKNSIISRSPLMSNKGENQETRAFQHLSKTILTLNSNNIKGIKFFNN